MKQTKFSSPKEEALEIAIETRKAILDGEKDVVSIIRKCEMIAKNLGKSNDEKIFRRELEGYEIGEVPNYRMFNCYRRKGSVTSDKPKRYELALDIPTIYFALDLKDEYINIEIGPDEFAVMPKNYLRALVERVKQRCFEFLHSIVMELQYGGVVEHLMEELRKTADKKLAKLSEQASQEIDSIRDSLSSGNPSDLTKVGHSCRKILKLVADAIFPPKVEEHKLKTGEKLKVTDDKYLNRLIAFIDEKTSGDKREFLLIENQYLTAYLGAVEELMQRGEHAKSIEKLDAELIAIHTYLLISEILRLHPAISE